MTLIQKDTYLPMIIAVLFKVPRTWRRQWQPKKKKVVPQFPFGKMRRFWVVVVVVMVAPEKLEGI